MFRYEYSVWKEFVQRGGGVRVNLIARGFSRDNEFLAFSAPIKPHSLTVSGESVSGIRVVKREDGVFNYYIFKSDNRRRVKFKVSIKGRYSREVFDGKRYENFVEWIGRHQHVLVFHGSFSPRVVSPKRFLVDRKKGMLHISWLWEKGYKGKIFVTLSSAQQ